MKKYIAGLLFGAVLTSMVSCNDEDEMDGIEIPTSYTFERDGKSSVSFSGQTDRLNMLSEIKSYVQNGDAGNAVSADVLNDMFANENDAFTSADLNNSTKQLESKTFIADVQFFKALFVATEVASNDYVANETMASSGVSGRIERGTSGKFILVNEKGWEFTQMIEKGLMGAVFLNQIYNVYLTDDRIGAGVDNETLVEGTNYTAKEHHFDEAFGYWGVPVDFPAEISDEDRRFWAQYSYGREPLTSSVTNLKEAFLKGRTAIVNDDQQELNANVDVLYSEFEILAAATAIHYINGSLSALSGGDQGTFLHELSEAYMFVRALKYSPFKSITQDQFDTILNEDFGTDGDFWSVSASGLTKAKNTLTSVYPSLSTVADEL